MGLELKSGPGKKELADFLDDLATLHDAGVPLRRALDLLAGHDASRHVRELSQLMMERLDAGADLGAAARISGQGDLALAAELARAGEMSGRLGETLRVGSTILERQSVFATRLRSAMAYPVFLLVLSFAAIIALSVFAGPALAPILEEAPGDAGGLAGLIAFGNFLRAHGLFLLALSAAFGSAFVLASRRPPLDKALAVIRLKTPGIAPLVRDLNCGAFARTFGALVAGGAPAARALELAAASATNSAWRARLNVSADALREGRTVAAALQAIEGLPEELIHLTKVGQEAGALGDMARRAGDILIARALRRLDVIAALAGPVLLVAMGGIIAWIMSAFLGGLSGVGDFAI